MDVVFTNIFSIDLSYYKPYPAQNKVANWYKELESYIGGEKVPNGSGTTLATIKRCMPVFDMMSAGYIIPTYLDVYVSQRNGQPHYEWPSLEALNFHPLQQAPNHPKSNGTRYPKWINPWSVRTPKGYSALFIPPSHADNTNFTIFPGLVDTDKYYSPVNFPFVLNDVKFEGLIPAGTPMVQVIPIRREKWKLIEGTKEDLKKQQNVADLLRTSIWDSYKTKFRTKKEFF